MGVIKNRVGETHGHWIVIAHDDEQSTATKKQYWICECDCGCGTRKSIRGDSLHSIIVGGCNNMTMKEPKICEKCGDKFYPKKQANSRCQQKQNLRLEITRKERRLRAMFIELLEEVS